MSAKRTPDSPQNVWQNKFLTDYDLTPFTSDQEGLKYHRLRDPKTWWHNPDWWHNPLNPNSLRLTKTGFTILEKANVKNHKFVLTKKLVSKSYIQLEKYFTSPYYIQNANMVFVFGETETMMLMLHGNNLQQYLDNHSN